MTGPKRACPGALAGDIACLDGAQRAPCGDGSGCTPARLLGLPDGRLTVNELAAIMRATWAGHGLEGTPATVHELTHRLLWLLVHRGLLINMGIVDAGFA